MNDGIIIIITTILFPHLSSSVLYHNIINSGPVVLTLTKLPARKDAVTEGVWYFSISNCNPLIRLCPGLCWLTVAGSRVPEIRLQSESELHLAPETDRVGGCGATITDLKVGSKGYIRSPGYPADYPADVKCTWWLKSKGNGRISLTCNDVR